MHYIFLLIILCQLCKIPRCQVLEWEQNLYKKLFHSYTRIVQISSSSELIKSQEYQVCTEELYTDITYKHDVLYNIIKYSGKELLEVGSEEECLNNKMAYFLLIIIKYNSDLYTLESASDIFINNLNSFFGFCIMKDCVGFIEKIFNAEQNPRFHDYLGEAANIFSVELMRAEETINLKEGYETKKMQVFIWVIISLVFYLCIKMIFFFLEMTVKGSDNPSSSLFSDMDYEYDEYESANSKDYYLKSKTDLFDKITNQSLNEKIRSKTERLITNDKTESKAEKEIKLSKLNITKSIGEREDGKYTKTNDSITCFNILYVILSFGSGINLLITSTSFVYNKTGLEMFDFLKVWSLFWMTYQHNLWALIRIPTKDIANVAFFKSLHISIVKYSTYALDMYIIIDGLILGYKLMMYTKQFLYLRKNKELTINALLSFYVNIIPKASLFLFVFFMFHFFTDNFSILFNLGTMFKYYIKNFIYCRTCIKNPIDLLKNPITFLYKDFSNQERGFNQCFKFVHIFVNELICSIIIIILFYLSLRIKIKKFDYTLLFLFSSNIFLSFLSINSFKNGDYYSLIIFMGESSSLKYPHLFFNTYFSGFLIGISIFYYKDMISNNPLNTNYNIAYKPFSYCHHFIVHLDRLKKNTKMAFIVLTIFIQCILSCSFYLLCHCMNTLASDGLNFTYTPLLSLFDMYEKNLFIFAFSLMIILIIVYPNDTLFRQVYTYSIFTPFSRVGFSYFCSMDTLIYMFYSLCKIELHLSYFNLLLMTIGLVILLSIINCIVVVMIELPIRIIIKLIKRNTFESHLIGQQSITLYLQ